MKPPIGRARRELYAWLTQGWLEDGPPVCFLQGFPGTGKSELARHVKQYCQQHKIPSGIAEITHSGLTLNDLFFALSGQLAADGAAAVADAISSGGDLLTAAEVTLRSPCLFVIDEAQHLFERGTGRPSGELGKLLNRLKHQPAFKGRVLVVIDRKFDAPEWAEVFEVRELHKLELKEGDELLDRLLTTAGRGIEVPATRRRGIVVSLDANPRALQAFVGCLAFDSVDNILGEDPGLWALGDRAIAARLVQQLENRLLEKTLTHLEPRPRTLLQSLSVHRTTFQKRAIEKRAGVAEVDGLIDVLVKRFVLRQSGGYYSINPIARELSLIRLRQKPASFQRAHGIAADYHLGPFQARQMTGDVSALAPRFAELRYHLANARRNDELREIVRRFVSYLRVEFTLTKAIPIDRESIDEQISVLSVVLEQPGPSSLEFYLARLLDRRRGPDDLPAALIHARRSAGPGSSEANWVLLMRLEKEINGLDAAMSVLKDTFRTQPAANGSFSLYRKGAELLSDELRAQEAIALLEQGLLYVPKSTRPMLYRTYAEILARFEGKRNAIDLLRNRGLKETLPEENAFMLYEYCAQLLAEEGDTTRAIALLRDGLDNIPDNTVFGLYQMAGKILARANDVQEALAIYRQGGRRLAASMAGPYLVSQAMLMCVSIGDRDTLVELLSEPSLSAADVIYGRALLAILDDEWDQASSIIQAEIRLPNSQLRLVALAAFCALAAGAVEVAVRIAKRLEPFLEPERREPAYWLLAVIALRVGDVEWAARNIVSLSGRPLGAAEEVSLAFLLRYWDESPNQWHGVNVAFVYPKLPPEISGLAKSITRPVHGGPVLPRVREVLDASEEERGRRKVGPKVLLVATEWQSGHGGLSTFNREMAQAIARTGSQVYCYIPKILPGEREQAATTGVTLLESLEKGSEDFAVKLRRRPPLEPGTAPDIIIGHDRITGGEAQALRDDYFPHSKSVLFIHTAPREIEWYKPPDPGETSSAAADERARRQKQLALHADVVAAVGPKLFAAIQTELVGESKQPKLTRIDPGMRVNVTALQEPQIVNCLLVGRAEDDNLKGLDIAARALGILRGRFEAPGHRNVQLVVRGATAGSGDALRQKLLDVSGNSQLRIDVRPFTIESEQLRAEIRAAWLVVMPSRSEGFGLVALETIAECIPVLVGEESGIATLIRRQLPELADNVCVSYHNDLEVDAQEWATRIEFILRDREAAIRRASELRDALRTPLTWDRAAAELFATLVTN